MSIATKRWRRSLNIRGDCSSPAQGGFWRAYPPFVAALIAPLPAPLPTSTLSDLSVLLAHSLNSHIVPVRYDLHPLIQEFAAGKLAMTAVPLLFDAHAAYYLPCSPPLNQPNTPHCALTLRHSQCLAAGCRGGKWGVDRAACNLLW